jgi:hypothetical protein
MWNLRGRPSGERPVGEQYIEKRHVRELRIGERHSDGELPKMRHKLPRQMPDRTLGSDSQAESTEMPEMRETPNREMKVKGGVDR